MGCIKPKLGEFKEILQHLDCTGVWTAKNSCIQKDKLCYFYICHNPFSKFNLLFFENYYHNLSLCCHLFCDAYRLWAIQVIRKVQEGITSEPEGIKQDPSDLKIKTGLFFSTELIGLMWEWNLSNGSVVSKSHNLRFYL